MTRYDWAFAEAAALVEEHGGYLDRLTIQLERRGRIAGGVL